MVRFTDTPCMSVIRTALCSVDCWLLMYAQKARANQTHLRLTLEQAKEQERQALYVNIFTINCDVSCSNV